MAGYFSSRIQATDIKDTVSSYTDKIIVEAEEQLYFDDTEASTSTTSLNEIPSNVTAPYPPPNMMVRTKRSVPSFRPCGNSPFCNQTYKQTLYIDKLDKSAEVSDSELEESTENERSHLSSNQTSAKGPSPTSSSRRLHRTASLLSNGASRYSLGVFESETFTEEAQALFPPIPLKLRPDGVENPNVPPLSIICCNMYPNDDLAQAPDLQDKFFSRIFFAKLIQLLVIIIWILFKSTMQFIQESILENFALWFYIPSAVYLALLIFVRWIPSQKTRLLSHSVLIYTIMTISVALVLGSIETHFRSNIFLLAITVLFCSTALIVALTWYGNYKVMSTKTSLMTALNAISSTSLIFLLVNLKSWNIYFEDLAIIWLPILISTSLILMVYVQEVKCVIAGRRFPVSSSDWLYATCFL